MTQKNEEKLKLLDIRKKLKAKKPEFIRKDSFKISRLGKRRKKKQKWRRPRGRHSKVREKKKGHIRQPSIGWSSPREVRGTLNGLNPKVVYNIKDLANLKETEIAVIGRVGKKKKIELAKYAFEHNIKLSNLNVSKYIEENKEKKTDKNKEENQQQNK